MKEVVGWRYKKGARAKRGRVRAKVEGEGREGRKGKELGVGRMRAAEGWARGWGLPVSFPKDKLRRGRLSRPTTI